MFCNPGLLMHMSFLTMLLSKMIYLCQIYLPFNKGLFTEELAKNDKFVKKVKEKVVNAAFKELGESIVERSVEYHQKLI